MFGDPVVATALRDRLLHYAIVQIEGASYRLRQHVDTVPEHTRVMPILRRLRSQNAPAANPEEELTIKDMAAP
ncbi:MAG: ATP-binding protein [Gluconobacter potus]|uniref:ATP-binding protein n=1 Tax=Acetobacteraceae TaxID=433 RepID=UPI000AB64564|nr:MULTISPECIES: ATP-binding protein [Acetobacteraceae]WEQ54923.1 ATP-binding protein [Komagataeibacter nataicola]